MQRSCVPVVLSTLPGAVSCARWGMPAPVHATCSLTPHPPPPPVSEPSCHQAGRSLSQWRSWAFTRGGQAQVAGAKGLLVLPWPAPPAAQHPCEQQGAATPWPCGPVVTGSCDGWLPCLQADPSTTRAQAEHIAGASPLPEQPPAPGN